ncbi:4'-phosphopantetheinyl transferase superfamily protein [Ignatzschineria larvae DSM 13226]|uniref:4'-phosphopantetheinyl transferase superfamily protein n=1 Tax=Ignatzschineria larvae DSM 13226 TaxID=1111732 RepID=A0ABZ3BYF2_9GAMM|nr:4'-phosphopantetheinyl transferase superfamily protein [Ignatzschineria larvae]
MTPSSITVNRNLAEEAPRVFLLNVDEATIDWAHKNYPQFFNEKLRGKRQISYLLSRALLLHVLQNYYDFKILPELAYSAHGKPYFPTCNISFNLTHTDQFLGLLITRGNHPLGIDIETIKPRRNFAGLLQKTFSITEIQWILGLTEQPALPLQKNLTLSPEAIERFFLLWSAKEAYLKADGRGLQALHTLLLKPKHQIMQGDLQEGTLLLQTLNHQRSATKSAFALYLPTSMIESTCITDLSNDPAVPSSTTFSSHFWQIIMREISHNETPTLSL